MVDDILSELEQIGRYLAAYGHGWVRFDPSHVHDLRARRDELLMMLPGPRAARDTTQGETCG